MHLRLTRELIGSLIRSERTSVPRERVERRHVAMMAGDIAGFSASLEGRIEYLRPTVWSRSSSTTRSAGPRRMAPSSTFSVVPVHGRVRG